MASVLRQGDSFRDLLFGFLNFRHFLMGSISCRSLPAQPSSPRNLIIGFLPFQGEGEEGPNKKEHRRGDEGGGVAA